MRRSRLACAVANVVCLTVVGLSATLSGDAPRSQAPAQVVIAVGILPFQDESGIGVPTLGAGVAQLVRSRLSSQHRDTLPKLLLVPGADAAAGPATVEQLQALGRQYSVKYVIQGGVLPVEVAPPGNAPTITVSLYADVVALDTGQTQTVRVDATTAAPTPGLGIPDPRSTDVTSAAFAQTPVGQALGDASARLADAIYQCLTASPVTGVQPPSAQGPPPPSAAPVPAMPPAPSPQEMDAEVQQLVADSQNAILSYGGAAPQLADQLRGALEQLNAALAQKADQMARGQDTQVVDQSIAQVKESVRASLNALVQAQMSGQALPPGQSGAPAESVMSRVNTFTSDMLSLLQKIQELRALFGGANQEAAATGLPQGAAGYPPADPSLGTQPVEQAPGSVSGVVVQEGQPVGGASVTETSTGVTTTTAPDGSYTLAPLPPGLLGVLSVKRQSQLVASGQVQVLAARASLADFQLQKGGVASTRLGVLGSSVMPRVVPPNAGTLMGRVSDARGNPVARALVAVPSVGMVRTNSRGEFLMSGVAAGVYTVNVRDTSQGVATTSVQIAAGRTPTVSNVRLQASPGRAVPEGPARLLVTDRTGALVHGRVRDQKDRNLPGVRVSLLRGEGTLSVLTDAGGSFALQGVSPGEYRVVVARPGFETTARVITLEAKGDRKIEVTLKQVTAMVDTIRQAEASRRAALAGKPGEARAATAPSRTMPATANASRVAKCLVQGHVIDAQTRRPIAGAAVRLSGGGGSALTDRYGAFRIDNLAPGAAEISVSRAGYLGQQRKVTLAADKTPAADFALRAAVLPKR
jgi:hypothetical protein